MQDAGDWRKLSAILERQQPNYPPGSMRFYHVLTSGWLLDQVVRRVDPQSRSIGDFFHDEIAKPNDIDFYIGLPLEHEPRVAKLSSPSFYDLFTMVDDEACRRIALHVANPFSKSLIKRAFTTPSWLSAETMNIDIMNDRRFHALEVPAGNGIGTARSLAKLFARVLSGHIISPRLLRTLLKPTRIKVKDELFDMTFTTGWGFMYGKNPMGQYVFMHPGFGGQNLKVDPYHNISMAYLTNKIKLDLGEKSFVFRRLQTAVYECLENIRSNEGSTSDSTTLTSI